MSLELETSREIGVMFDFVVVVSTWSLARTVKDIDEFNRVFRVLRQRLENQGFDKNEYGNILDNLKEIALSIFNHDRSGNETTSS